LVGARRERRRRREKIYMHGYGSTIAASRAEKGKTRLVRTSPVRTQTGLLQYWESRLVEAGSVVGRAIAKKAKTWEDAA